MIEQETSIPGTDYILEAGDRIRITELLDNPADYDITVDEVSTLQAEFVVGEIPYRVIISGDVHNEEDSEYKYKVFFSATTEDGRTGAITDTGNAPIVFSTVAAIIDEHYERYGSYVEAYSFTAKEKSRQKLYDRLSQLLKRELGFSRVNKRDTFIDGLEFVIEV